ncbi:pimeloyl-ACP methyl ester carboxylesterase [Streptosporangium album]|uniref:Pimeloyl-ACP methyl ester carboxylesterase n=1 Tax=Streptosporangium album TaxID=47479 RepID=A0A7W7S794_9ACTN|nr:alpha/beta hydrolase [Streptosporangium album]MBB4944141.1 pimeloyl-ACP methyl ester carboxylesterase [Streptosporangium album]
MPTTSKVDGFQLHYDVMGDGPPTVLLHGWPGDRTDYRRVARLLAPTHRVVVPDLRGFGESGKHAADPREQYGAAGQARSVIGLIEELRLDRPVLGGYDIGSRIAQKVAQVRPDLVGGLVLSPPLPGIAERVFGERAQREFWYQAFHQLPLAERLIDGRPEAVRDYLLHFWSHWSGPGFEPSIDHLIPGYAEPGAFTASIAWYRAGAGTVAASAAERQPDPAHRISTPAIVLWPEHDPLFPRDWSDRLAAFFRDFELRPVDGVGHFTPLECPGDFADAVAAAGS